MRGKEPSWCSEQYRMRGSSFTRSAMPLLLHRQAGRQRSNTLVGRHSNQTVGQSRALPVMHVPVEDGDAAQPQHVEGIAGRHHGEVEDAETHGLSRTTDTGRPQKAGTHIGLSSSRSREPTRDHGRYRPPPPPT